MAIEVTFSPWGEGQEVGMEVRKWQMTNAAASLRVPRISHALDSASRGALKVCARARRVSFQLEKGMKATVFSGWKIKKSFFFCENRT